MEIRVEGIVKNTSSWVYIGSADAGKNDSVEQVEETAQKMRDLFGRACTEKASGYLHIGKTMMDIQSFAAISVKVVK